MSDTRLDIKFISILKENDNLDVEVTFIANSELGEIELVVVVEQVKSIDAAVDQARRKVRKFGQDLAGAAETSFFQK